MLSTVFESSQIRGAFLGWYGSTAYSLRNGHVWRQLSDDVVYAHTYQPTVTVFQEGDRYFMEVQGTPGLIEVERAG